MIIYFFITALLAFAMCLKNIAFSVTMWPDEKAEAIMFGIMAIIWAVMSGAGFALFITTT